MKLIEIEYLKPIKDSRSYDPYKKTKISINPEYIIGIEEKECYNYMGGKTEKTIIFVKEMGSLEAEESYESFLKRLKTTKLNKFEVITMEKDE